MRLIHRLKFFAGRILKKHPLLFPLAWLALRKFGRSLPHDKSFFGFKYLATEPGGLFLDIGANNGLSALSFHQIQPNFKIFSIEINHYHRPAGFGVRVDDFIYSGYKVTPFYDSMIAKLICHAPDRETCINRMLRALEETVIEGISTNRELHQRILQNEDFRGNNYSTNFLAEKMQ